ncbi:MAG: AMP-binding protein [Planctomycetes bacterium]|nr:AMP-binding protein [Planctomycetota bacterium]
MDPFAAFPEPPADANIAHWLRDEARARPDQAAVVWPRGARWQSISFARLDERSDGLARGLRESGLRRGERACVFLRPGGDFLAAIHALFKLGAVPVLIDPGMGRANLLACVERAAPRALLAVGRAQLAKRLWPRAFRSVELCVSSAPLGLGGIDFDALARTRGAPFPIEPRDADELAAILYTSGSTGPPKGVGATHRVFRAQLSALRSLYAYEPGTVDAACFPLFALFDNALGMTSLFPPLDPATPARCEPGLVARAIEEHGARSAFASPAVWWRVVHWLKETAARFTTLQTVTSAGAPIPLGLVERLQRYLPAGAAIHTPYGATEALPVASIASAELLGACRAPMLDGWGTPLGRAAPGIDLRVIRIDDAPIARWSDELELPRGAIGEFAVRGPVVTRGYEDDAAATALARIAPAPSQCGSWHRMGDLGWLDEKGRAWFCGRKSERIETARGLLVPVPAENPLNEILGVRRSALVGVGARPRQVPRLLVERSFARPGLFDELRARPLAQPPATAATAAALGPIEVELHKGFPVDARHNAKIRRDLLRAEAEARA